MSTCYRYSFDKRLIVFWGVFGVRRLGDGVTLTDDGRLRATFGFLELDTARERRRAHITRHAAGGRRPAPGVR